MSHIQKILERAERDGSIRPNAVPLVADVPRATATAEAVYPADLAFPTETVLPAPAPAIVPDVAPAGPGAPAVRVASARISGHFLHALTPGTPTAEQFRAIRARVHQSANGRGLHAIAVTSPGRGEGRTYTAGNLALTMAQENGRRVCLVDANLRSPDLRRLFGLPEGPGLIEVLHERARLEDALVHLPEQNLTILPGGDPTTQSDVLASTAMRRVMQSLRAGFDRIVVDAPAVLTVADVALLTPLVDGLMLVVRAGVTPRAAIHDAVEAIDSDKLLGVVLNDAR